MTSPYVLKSWGSREIHLVTSQCSSFFSFFLPEKASHSRCNRFSGSRPFCCLVLSSASVCLSVSLPPPDGIPASNAPVSTAVPARTAFSTTEVKRVAADGHPAPDAPELSGTAAPTDTSSTTGLNGVDSGDVAPRTVLLTSTPRPMHRFSSELVSTGNAAACCCVVRPPFPKYKGRLHSAHTGSMLPTTLWEESPCEVAESVIRRPQNTSSWTGSEAEC